MTSTSADRRLGVNPGKAVKVPCIAATTANITLEGEQTLDGVACVSGNRVLVKDQTDATENGIYEVNTSSWVRTIDANDVNDLTYGTLIFVASGTLYGGFLFKVATTGTITPGTTSISINEVTTFTDTLSAFATTLLDDVSADAFWATLMATLTKSTALNSLGFSAYFRTLISSADASALLTLLGSSSFFESIITASDALDARQKFFAAPTISADGVLAPHKNLTVKNNTSNPNYQLDIDAGELLLSNTTNLQYKAVSVNLTADITASGVNGLDTGSEALSTWYHAWVILNPTAISSGTTTSTAASKLPDSAADFSADGVKVGDMVRNTTDGTITSVTAVDSGVQLSIADDIFTSGDGYEILAMASLLSTSSTAPTMPAGYTYKGYVGAIYNGSGSNFIVVDQIDKFVSITPVFDLSSGSSTSYASVALTTPTTARKVYGYAANIYAGNQVSIFLATKSTGQSEIALTVGATGATATNVNGYFSLPLIEEQTLYYKVVAGTGGAIRTGGWEY